MRKVRIKRSKWLRGISNSNGIGNVLWDEEANAGCCLGHVCKQISRKTEKQLNGRCTPADIYVATSVLTDSDGMDNELAQEAMKINDKTYLTGEAQREEDLRHLFAINGIELTFYD
jgi:hypothetical protein